MDFPVNRPSRKVLLNIRTLHKSTSQSLKDISPEKALSSPSVNVNIRMYNFDDVQCTVIPSVAYGFVTGMNLQLC